MDMWIKITVVTLLVIGSVWVVVGICGAYRELDPPETKYYSGKPMIWSAFLTFAASLSAAAITWSLAAGIMIAWRFHLTFYAYLALRRGEKS